jgi:hypothetical protein
MSGALPRSRAAGSGAAVGLERSRAHLCPAGRGESVHTLPAEHASRVPGLSSARVVCADLHPADEIDVRHLVGNRILRHRRQRAEDVLRPAGRPALIAEHVGDERERMAPLEVPEEPVAQPAALDLDVEHLADAAVVSRVRSACPRVPLGPGGGVGADRLWAPGPPVAQVVVLVDRALRVRALRERALAAVPLGLVGEPPAIKTGHPRHPDRRAGWIHPPDRPLVEVLAHAALSSRRLARYLSTSRGSILRTPSTR